MVPNAVVNHAKVDEAVSGFAELARAIKRPELSDRIAPMLARYRVGEFRLMVLGAEKRGKSSLLNALLGTPNLLPTGPQPMTSCVFELIYGAELRCEIHFLPTDPDAPAESRAEPLEVTPPQLREYGTEDGNPDNLRQVDFVRIEYPHPLLKAGLTIVDLPGLGGLNREHSQVSLRYAASADATLFVVDSVTGALNRDEIGSLEQLRISVGQIAFVQTKLDCVSALQSSKWRERNLGEIERRLGFARGAFSYFLVSSVLKTNFDEEGEAEDLAESGFVPLLSFLEDAIVARKLDLLAAPLLEAIALNLEEALHPLRTEAAILEAEGPAGAEQLQVALDSARSQYEAWKRDVQPEIAQRFAEAFRKAEIDGDRAIARDLDPSDQGPLVGGAMTRIEQDQGATSRDLIDQSAAWNDRVVEACARQLDVIGARFDQETLAAFELAATETAVAAAPLEFAASRCPVELPFERPHLKNHVTVWSTLMHGRLGLMSGTMIAGAFASLFFPPMSLAVAAASLIGGLFGAERSIKEAQHRDRISAENRLRLLLTDSARRLQQHGFREFRVVAEKRRKAMVHSLSALIERRDWEEADAAQALQRRRAQSDDQCSARKIELSQFFALGDAVADAMREAREGAVSNAHAAAA